MLGLSLWARRQLGLPCALFAVRSSGTAADRRCSAGGSQAVAGTKACAHGGGAGAAAPAARWGWPATWRGLLRSDGEESVAFALGDAAPAGDVPMPPPAVAGAPQASPAATLSPAQEEARYWRERRAAAQRCGAGADLAECDRQIHALEQAAQASRPWAVRVQAAADSQRAAAAKLQVISEDLAEARRAVQHFESEAAQAQQALQQAKEALAAVQAEATPAPAAPAPGPLSEAGVAAAFDTLAAATAARQRRGGEAGGDGGGEAASSSNFAPWSLLLCAGPVRRLLPLVRRRPRAGPPPLRQPTPPWLLEALALGLFQHLVRSTGAPPALLPGRAPPARPRLHGVWCRPGERRALSSNTSVTAGPPPHRPHPHAVAQADRGAASGIDRPWLVGFLGPGVRPVERVALARHPGGGCRTPRANRAPPGGQCH